MVRVELQNVPAGHRVNLFEPSAAQYAPAGHSAHVVLLVAPEDSRYLPASQSVGAVVALLGQYAPTVQVLQSSILAAPIAGKNGPIGHGFGVEEEDGQKKPAGHA